jgi:hypothetical protein
MKTRERGELTLEREWEGGKRQEVKGEYPFILI